MVSRPGPRIVPPAQQPGESLSAANARMRAANRVIAAEDMRRQQAAREARLQRPPGMNLPPVGAPPREPREPMPPSSQINPQQPNVMGFRDEPMGPGARGAEMMGPGGRGDIEFHMRERGELREPRPTFKKGGPVKAKAPVKKKAGGMIAKPKAAAAAKPKGKAMPAFKKGGAVKGKR